MSKFKIGDRVKSINTGRLGTIQPVLRVQWDGDPQPFMGMIEPAAVEPIPNGLVVEFHRPENCGSGLCLVNVDGISPEQLNGKFRLVPVEE